MKTKYREGLEELLYVAPTYGSLARAMGAPILSNEYPTAWLFYESEQKEILFSFNPDFLEELNTEETAAVILHELHHLILDHLMEGLETETYPDSWALEVAHECIVNDKVETFFQLPLPGNPIRGMDTVGRNCSRMATKQVYDLLERESIESPLTCSGLHGKGDWSEALEDLLEEVAKEQGKTLEEVKDELLNAAAGGYMPDGGVIGEEYGKYGSIRLNWRKLLAIVNPKIMEEGRKAQERVLWTRPNRRLSTVYPKIILPSNQRIDKKGEIKDEIPSFVVALDLSGSIPRGAVSFLKGLIQEIPEELIKAYPCTWSDDLVPMENGRTCRSGGTDINLVSRYVKRIEEQDGVSPYVLVITDGQFRGNFARPGQDWFFMAINRISMNTCRRHARDSDHLFLVDDFR